MKQKTRKILSALLSLVLALSFMCSAMVVPAEAIGESKATYDGYYKDENVRRWWYARLNKKEKACYRAIVAQLDDMPMRIEIPYKLDDDMSNNLWYAISYDNPEFFQLAHMNNYGESGGKYYYIPVYIMTKSMYKQGKEAMNKKMKQVLKKAKTKKTDYAKIRYLHDWLCNYVNYSYDGQQKYCVYGTFMNQKVNCEGYSRTMQLFMNKLGIVNHVMVGMGFSVDEETGEENAGGHMWNIVTVNGKEYNLDATWDDALGGYTQYGVYFPTGVEGEPSHAYFMRSSKAMSGDHRAIIKSDDYGFTTGYVWKGATDDSQNFFSHNGLNYKSYNKTTRSAICKGIAKAINSGKKSYEISFTNKKAYDKAVDKIFGEGKEDKNRDLNDMIKEINKQVTKKENKITIGHIVSSCNDNMYTIEFFPNQEVEDNELLDVLAIIFQLIPSVI